MTKKSILPALLVALAILAGACAPQTGNVTSGTTGLTAPVSDTPLTSETGTNASDTHRETDAAESVAAKVPAEYAFDADGTAIRPTVEAASVAAFLARAEETGEAPSCAFEGLDKVFRYDGYEIQTGKLNGVEYVTGVIILDDRVKTPEGLAIGMSLDDMLRLYGDDYKEDFGQYIYEDEAVKLVVIIDSDEVLTISYIGKFDAFG